MSSRQSAANFVILFLTTEWHSFRSNHFLVTTDTAKRPPCRFTFLHLYGQGINVGGENIMDSFFGHASLHAARKFYDEEGYLILKNWFPHQTVERLADQARELWHEPRNERLVVDFGSSDLANSRMLLCKAPVRGAVENHKINDLFLESDEFRSIFLSESMVGILSVLLGGSPTICNSLHFTFGSTQRAHFDTWYMPPPVEDKMAVAAVPLEPYTLENGPLFYYPRSHLIPKYKFSTGHIRAIEVEMPKCDEYLFGEIEKRSLKKELFFGGVGDMFIWHSQLLHGGSPVTNPNKTRRSVVVHYWRNGDIDSTQEYPWMRGKERASYHGYYVERDHQKAGVVVDVEGQAKQLGLIKEETPAYDVLKAQYDALAVDRNRAQDIMETQLVEINRLKAEISMLRGAEFPSPPGSR
jgi:phytanoyl-CoA hydroxylase